MPLRFSPDAHVLLVTSAFPCLGAVALEFSHSAKIVGVALAGKQAGDAFPDLTLASGVSGGDDGDAVPGPGGGDVGREEACRGDGCSGTPGSVSKCQLSLGPRRHYSLRHLQSIATGDGDPRVTAGKSRHAGPGGRKWECCSTSEKRSSRSVERE